MMDTVTLTFKATSATLITRFSKEYYSSVYIIYKLENDQGQKVFTDAGVDITDFDWSVQVTDFDEYNDHVGKNGGIGVMKYWNTDGNCYITAAIGELSFNRLSHASHLPTQVRVEARGLEHGKGFESTDIIWPQTDEVSIVTGVEFSVPMGNLPDASISVTSKNEMLEVALKAIKPLYVIAIAVVLIAFKLYFS